MQGATEGSILAFGMGIGPGGGNILGSVTYLHFRAYDTMSLHVYMHYGWLVGWSVLLFQGRPVSTHTSLLNNIDDTLNILNLFPLRWIIPTSLSRAEVLHHLLQFNLFRTQFS